MSDAGGAKTASRSRRGYLDWLRGVAVLIMIEAHVIDSWTRFPDRQTHQFGWALIVGGFGAPLFLFLAGVAVSMSAGAKSRRSGDDRRAADAVARRGLEIFALAFLFRVQAWILGWSSPRDLLKVDILNIMGPSIVAAVMIWRLARTPRGRYIALSAATLVTAFVTPLIREWAPLTHLPDPIEAYIRPIAGLSNFVFFPWMAFVFAGAVVGLALDDARSTERERLTNVTFFLAGAATACIAYRLSFLPTWYPVSRFWTTSPAFFFLRIGLMTMAIGVAYFWELRPGGAERWSPLRQLGRTSLFIYWIHVEMVYGLISLSLHKHLSLPQAWVALALFSVFMLACSIAKDRFVGWWGDKGARVPRGQGARVPEAGC
jgi:uncharacterized membrane protein